MASGIAAVSDPPLLLCAEPAKAIVPLGVGVGVGVGIDVGVGVGVDVGVGKGVEPAGCNAACWAMMASPDSPLAVVTVKLPVTPAAFWFLSPDLLER